MLYIYYYIIGINFKNMFFYFSDEQSRKAYIMNDWTVGAFSESLEEKVKKLNLYRIPEFPKDTFIRPRKRAEYWPPHMVSSNQLQKAQQDLAIENNNSITPSTTNNKSSIINTTTTIAVANNVNSIEIKNKINQSLNTSSNETVNDFILVELVILLKTNFTLVYFV